MSTIFFFKSIRYVKEWPIFVTFEKMLKVYINDKYINDIVFNSKIRKKLDVTNEYLCISFYKIFVWKFE